jgi:hypothetical protein
MFIKQANTSEKNHQNRIISNKEYNSTTITKQTPFQKQNHTVYMEVVGYYVTSINFY